MQGSHLIAGLMLLAASHSSAVAPGCGCPVSACCGEDLFADAFAGILTAQNETSAASVSSSVFGSHAWAPACSLLNLIPGIESEGGLCHPSTTISDDSLDVCGAVAADEAAAGDLRSGSPRLGLFVEPGACGELESDACWTTPGDRSWYAEWARFRSAAALPGSQSCSSTSVHRAGDACPAMLVGLQCPANSSHPDGVRVVVRWVDAGSRERACDAEGDLDEVLRADQWMEGDRPGAPRWACFDVPRGSLGQESYRAVLYSVGELPCVAQADNTTDGISGTIDGAVGLRVATPLLFCLVAMVFQGSQ